MADILCGYTADRDETLVAYLYGEIEPSQRAAFEAHIATCDRCRRELEELQLVRRDLGVWTTPEFVEPIELPLIAEAPAPRSVWTMLRNVPTWAGVAAAALVLGLSAGLAGAIANLDVRYDHGGLSVRTGWSRAAASADSTTTARITGQLPAQSGAAGAAAAAPWQSDLESLERRLRSDLQPAASVEPARTDASSISDVQLLKRVRALVEDSERRQRNELALRMAQVVQEFDAKRGTDLASLRNMKTIQSATGLEVARQQQWLNLLTQASVQTR
jgi:hypothetical protein